MGERKLFTRNVSVFGFTQKQRDVLLQDARKLLDKEGWVLQEIKKAKFKAEAIFTKQTPPSFMENLRWNYQQYKPFVVLWGIAFVCSLIITPFNLALGLSLIMLLLGGPYYFFWNRSSKLGKFGLGTLFVCFLSLIGFAINNLHKADIAASAEQQARYDANDQQRHYTAKKVAKAFKQMIENGSGPAGGVFLDVYADESAMVVVKVSNSWLYDPVFVQNQNKQLIKDILKTINPPRGWDFYVVDYLGNKI